MKNYNWDLSQLYTSKEIWDKDYEEIVRLLQWLESKKESFINNSTDLFEFLEKQELLGILLTKIYVYAKTSFDVDMKNQENKKLFEIADELNFRVQDVLSFSEPNC